jgi:hypothetical protein
MSEKIEDEAYCDTFKKEIIMSEECNAHSCWAYAPKDKENDNYICENARACSEEIGVSNDTDN